MDRGMVNDLEEQKEDKSKCLQRLYLLSRNYLTDEEPQRGSVIGYTRNYDAGEGQNQLVCSKVLLRSFFGIWSVLLPQYSDSIPPLALLGKSRRNSSGFRVTRHYGPGIW